MMPSLTNRVPTNSATYKYRELKKNNGQMKIISQKMFLVQNKVVAQQFRVAAKELPQGQEQLMTLLPNVFSVIVLMVPFTKF